MRRNQYLEGIGLKTSNYGGNFVTGAKVKRFFERRKYGFDHREIVNMDISFAEWLYSHLMMYQEQAAADLTVYSVEFEGRTYAIAQAVEMILKAVREYLYLYEGLDMNGEKVTDLDRARIRKNLKSAVNLWGEIMWYVWI